MPLRCKICGQFISDGSSHVLRGSRPQGDGLMTPKDELHDKAIVEFASKQFKGPCPICGHKINIFVFGDKESPNWEVSCSGCSYLWDED